MKYEIKNLEYPVSEWFGTFDTFEEAEEKVESLRKVLPRENFIIRKIYPQGAAAGLLAKAA